MVESEYAGAVYELACEENKASQFTDYFKAITESLKDKEFYNLLTSPVITIAEKKEIIGKVFKSFDETFINFLFVIADHQRFNCIKGIAEQYNKLVMEAKNHMDVTVTSAYALSDIELERLEKSLKARYHDKTIKIINIVDPTLIGGVSVVADGQVIDITAKTALERLKGSL